MRNLENEFIELNKEFITEYMKLIFEEKYDKEISDLYIKRYIDVRYYNYIQFEKQTTLRRKIFISLKQIRAKMLSDFPYKSEIIEDMYLFYHYLLYIDNTLWCKDIGEIIDKMSYTRINLSYEQNTEFCKKMRELINKYNKDIEELLKIQETDKFNVKISNLDKDKKVYKVRLTYNIKFPEIYSEKSKDKVFETGIVKEDKLFIEYYLISNVIIKDIIKTRFQKNYIVDFTSTIFEKKSKLDRMLSIIDGEIIQDKLNFEVEYKDFIKNKEEYYNLIRKGYKLAILLDETFDDTDESINRLEIFNYILIDKDTKRYTRLLKNDKLEDKIIGM